MDQTQLQAQQQSQTQPQGQQQSPQTAGPAGQPGAADPQTSAPARKRKKTDNPPDDSSTEPRRLRRSHEACARCRSKKIKCDSKHPRCTACATAGTQCHQEDRHRQMLTPRGHLQHIENRLAQCVALLRRHIPNFEPSQLDDILAREGIDASADPNLTVGGVPVYTLPTPGARPFNPDESPPLQGAPGASPQASQKSWPYGLPPPPPGSLVAPGFAPHPMGIYPGPPGSYPPPLHLPGYNPQIHPGLQPPYALPSPLRAPELKGQDPQSNDMSSTEALAKNFGVHTTIMNDIEGMEAGADKEDLAVGSNGLSSGRDRDIGETSSPRDTTKWVSVFVRRNSQSSGTLTILPPGTTTNAPAVKVWLPKDRQMVRRILDVYFTHLNTHRPVFLKNEFEKTLDDLYEGRVIAHDPGFVCGAYLILALGTLCDLNRMALNLDSTSETGGSIKHALAKKKLMPPDWPEHEEFFERALSVKPDLRVTISSLQALILLHWYLYTERQGRTLWRLVGSMVRLAIELGLHHDPTTQTITITQPATPGQPASSVQQAIFSEAECRLRIRLWGIVMVHDRGTSILLGRPLAIAPSDSNTPHTTRYLSDFSEHFQLSQPVAEIQADIINSLYTPKRQSGDTIIRNATRIIKSMLEFRKSLPETYQFYFSGTDDWPREKRAKLVQDITDDQGLTLLKIGIARILLLRAVFSSKEVAYKARHKALLDAIITSHNVIIIHNQLIQYPDIGFFTSPIPLHIAAMVILYGQMSRVDELPRQVALEDLWMALDMLPRFRWRWERKDVDGGHPLIAKLAERVMEVDFHQVGPSLHPVLISELDWDMRDPDTVSPKSQQSTPTLATASYATPRSSGHPGVYGPHPQTMNGMPVPLNGNGGSSAQTPPDSKLADVPKALFYPFYPEAQHYAAGSGSKTDNSSNPGPGMGPGAQHPHDYSGLLAAAAQHNAPYQGSADSFMSEERDPNQSVGGHNMVWAHGMRGAPPYHNMPPQS